MPSGVYPHLHLIGNQYTLGKHFKWPEKSKQKIRGKPSGAKGKHWKCKRGFENRSKALKGNPNVIKAREGTHHSEKTKKKMAISHAKYISTHKKEFRETSIEKIMECIIKEWINYGIITTYFKQFRIGRYVVDFYIPKLNLIVECYGKFWHSGFAQKYRDMKRIEYLKRKGCEIQIYWEEEINKFRKSNGEKYLN